METVNRPHPFGAIGDQAALVALTEFAQAPGAAGVIFRTRSRQGWVGVVPIEIHFDFALAPPSVLIHGFAMTPRFTPKKRPRPAMGDKISNQPPSSVCW